MNEENLWNKALEISRTAKLKGALLPLLTETFITQNKLFNDFEVRTLISSLPKHLIKKKPNFNPFDPWDKSLEIRNIGPRHTLILNKYPVQTGHMLLITNKFMPQNGWLNISDFEALVKVDCDTTGLWFFNSDKESGASQPHRHIQLLRRSKTEIISPRYNFLKNINDINKNNYPYFKFNRYMDIQDHNSLYKNYLELTKAAELGDPNSSLRPISAYNLLITRDFICLIKRRCELCRGFNINALGFAGYILATNTSDMKWLIKNGCEALLRELV
tara:strand:- start:1008 stop:1829 length:822 start_codon:yes stop_codon:yes gene_type:complete